MAEVQATVLQSGRLHWHQFFGGSANNPIDIKIQHELDFQYYHGYKNLSFNLTLQRQRREDSFRKLEIRFESNRYHNFTKGIHYEYIILDRCAVRMVLKGTDGKNIARLVHVDCQKLQMSDYPPESMLLASFLDPQSISEEELNDLKTDKSDPDNEYCEIEIYSHLKMCCYDRCSQFKNSHYGLVNGFKKYSLLDLSLTQGTQLFSKCSANFLTAGLKEGKVADVKFVVESDSKGGLEAYSCILAAFSPVFRNMLSVDMAEKRTGVITIADATYASLEWFLGLLHGSKSEDDFFKLPVGDVFQIFSLAHKYQVDFVIRICSIVVMTYDNENLSVVDVQQIYKAGDLYGMPDLENRSFQWMKWRRCTTEGHKQVMDLLEECDEICLRKCCKYLFRFK